MPDYGLEIDVHALANMLSENIPHTVLDVREANEIEICSIGGSRSIPMQQVPQHLDTLPREHPLIVLCHHGTRSAMVTDSAGRIFLLTDHVANNIIIYDKDGRLLNKWGNRFPGAHGLEIVKEENREVLFITDLSLHRVFKTTLEGEVLMELTYPKSTGKYADENIRGRRAKLPVQEVRGEREITKGTQAPHT